MLESKTKRELLRECLQMLSYFVDTIATRTVDDGNFKTSFSAIEIRDKFALFNVYLLGRD